MGWQATRRLTRGNETLIDAERFDDRRGVATFILIVRNDLVGGHVNSVLAFRELADLVKNHVVDIEPLLKSLRTSSEMKAGRDEMVHTACSNMSERVDR
jgi:hypothetical protein